MLVPGDAADGDAPERGFGTEGTVGDAPETTAGGVHLGKGGERHIEEVTEFVRPPSDDDVVEERAGGVGSVGGEDPTVHTTGQVPEHPRVDRGQGQLAAPGHPSLVEEPAHLGGREVGVENEPGAFPDHREMALLGQSAAGAGGATVLPDDGPVPRPRRVPVPRHDGLALVGDADGPGRPTVLGQPTGHLVERDAHGLPDLVGVVLDPSGSWVELGELAVGDVDHPGPIVDHQGPDPGGPGVDGDGHRGAWGHTRTVVTPVRDHHRTPIPRGQVPRRSADRIDPEKALATSNHLQFFASALSTGNSLSRNSRKRQKFVDRHVTTLL